VPKYKHVAPEVLHVTPPELAAMCVLMLSGPQTVGEIRTRGYRLYEFSGLEEWMKLCALSKPKMSQW
jgi:uncharacterized protein YceH (UPF0502 family)